MSLPHKGEGVSVSDNFIELLKLSVASASYQQENK